MLLAACWRARASRRPLNSISTTPPWWEPRSSPQSPKLRSRGSAARGEALLPGPRTRHRLAPQGASATCRWKSTTVWGRSWREQASPKPSLPGWLLTGPRYGKEGQPKIMIWYENDKSFAATVKACFLVIICWKGSLVLRWYVSVFYVNMCVWWLACWHGLCRSAPPPQRTCVYVWMCVSVPALCSTKAGASDEAAAGPTNHNPLEKFCLPLYLFLSLTIPPSCHLSLWQPFLFI